jgi:energy-coupling factor transporter ATP-binding protein EcfA2
LIELEDLTVRYPRAPAPALRDLTLRVEAGETVLLLGPSGGGKSTLARALSGLIPHDIFAVVQGSLRVAGLDPLSAPPGEVAAQVGLLFQDPEAGFATLNVADEVAFGLENLRLPREEMPARIRSALEAVGLSGFELRRLDTLSGGEAQRVALAALLAMGTPLLVLDEPTANLDPAATREFFELLAARQPGHTILLIEHKLDACLPLAGRAILLRGDGSLLAEGPPERVFRDHLPEVLEAGIWLPESLIPEGDGRGTPNGPVLPTSDPPVVTVRGLTFAFKNSPPVLRDLDLDIFPGDFLALVGPNGSGKTTLARLLMGLLPRPPSGEIRLFGDALPDLPLEKLTERVGYVFQNPEHQFVTDTVEEELAYSLRARRWPEARAQERVLEMLERIGLRPLAGRNPFTLSQGEKRRLSVATMLAAGQQVLILDEPTFGQDRRTAYALMDALAELNRQGVVILIITHDLRFVRRYARRVAVLLEGRIAFSGTPGELFARSELLSAARLQ